MKTVFFEPGDIIFRAGDESDLIYYVTDGLAEILLETLSGMLPIGEIVVGDILGEMGLMTELPRSATARAITKLTCEALDEASFDEFILSDKGFLRAYLAKTFERLRSANNLIYDLRKSLQNEKTKDIPTKMACEETARERVSLQLKSHEPVSASGEIIKHAITTIPYKIGRITTSVILAENHLELHERPAFHLSRHHCSIERNGQELVIRDQSSARGTIVNGLEIGLRFEHVLAPLIKGNNELILGSKASPFQFTLTVN